METGDATGTQRGRQDGRAQNEEEKGWKLTREPPVLSRCCPGSFEGGHDVAGGDEHKHKVLVMGAGEWIGRRAVVIG